VAAVTISEKGQIVIPLDIRQRYELTPGTQVEFVDTVERWEAVKDAVELHRAGLDFADALHWASSKGCESMISFDKRVAKAAQRARTSPAVLVPS
jgi:AbrB family looped-hinge helix DNA binding protein